MQQRLGAFLGAFAAVLAGLFIIAGPASAAGDASVSASSLEEQAKKAQQKAAKSCSQAKKAKGKARAVAKRNCARDTKSASAAARKLRTHNAQFFDVCKRGCKFRTIQAGVDAAGKWQNSNRSRKATVRVQPGTYVEGVLVHGKREGHKFDGLTIMGVTAKKTPLKDASQVILEGTDAKTVLKGNPGWQEGDPETVPAQNAIEGRSTTGLVFKNMWARNYQNNTFFVWASTNPAFDERCADFVMDNLLSSDTRSYGLFSRNCYGGKFLNSEGWNHGDSALYIGETPCDSATWENRGGSPPPCQRNPKWTLVKNMISRQGSLGYSGTNSKYVRITDSTFYNNGAGIVPSTLDSEKFEPSGWSIYENNDIFWNNYNYYSTNREFDTVIGNGNPMGVGVMLYGSDSIIVRNNRIFGHEKWGVASFSGPQAFGVNNGDDAVNMNHQFMDNEMGRNGVDPNSIDFFNDHSGGGHCWEGNEADPEVSFAPGNGSVQLSTLYPGCPQPKRVWNNSTSLNLLAGLQVNRLTLGPEDGGPAPKTEPWRDLSTIFGIAELRPSKLQECSWEIATPHPAFTDAKDRTFIEKRTDPVDAQECTDLAERPAPWNP